MSTDVQILNSEGNFALGEHDIVFDAIGRLILLSGQPKLIQDIQKILFTNVNNFYNQYGTRLDVMIGSNLGIDQTINILGQKITDSLVYLQYLQEQQALSQMVLGSEIIVQILELNIDYLYAITQNSNDSRTFTVGIVIQSGDNQIVTIGNNITVV